MNSGSLKLLCSILDGEWTDVFAMPIQDNRSILFDLVFIIRQQQIALSGIAHSLSDGSEAFSIDVYPHVAEGWWTETEIQSQAWIPRNIKKELEILPSKSLICPPREVAFYADPRLLSDGKDDDSFLRACAGMIIFDPVRSNQACMAIAASNRYPCAIELGLDNGVRNSMMEGLVQFKLDATPFY